MKNEQLRITTQELYESEICDAVSKQIHNPSLNEAECTEWSQWDDSGIYHVPYVGKYARVWVDMETRKATRCELIGN
jgi:hypothetical protein